MQGDTCRIRTTLCEWCHAAESLRVGKSEVCFLFTVFQNIKLMACPSHCCSSSCCSCSVKLSLLLRAVFGDIELFITSFGP